MNVIEKSKRARGSGSIYQNGSTVWWIKFYDRGIPRRESSHSTNYNVAEKLLKRRLAEKRVETLLSQLPIVGENQYVYDPKNPYKDWQEGKFHWVPVGLD